MHHQPRLTKTVLHFIRIPVGCRYGTPSAQLVGILLLVGLALHFIWWLVAGAVVVGGVWSKSGRSTPLAMLSPFAGRSSLGSESPRFGGGLPRWSATAYEPASAAATAGGYPIPDIADPGGPRALGSRKFKAQKEGTLPLVLPLSSINPMQYMDRRTMLCAIAVTVLAAAGRAQWPALPRSDGKYLWAGCPRRPVCSPGCPVVGIRWRSPSTMARAFQWWVRSPSSATTPAPG